MPLPGGQLLAATPKRQGEWVGVYTNDDENGRYILDRKAILSTGPDRKSGLLKIFVQ